VFTLLTGWLCKFRPNSEGAEVFKVDKLVAAMQSRNHQRVEALLALPKADVNAKNSQNSTAIHFASTNGDLVMVKLLIDANADVHIANRHGYYPLHWAAIGDHLATVEELLVRWSVHVVTLGFGLDPAPRFGMKSTGACFSPASMPSDSCSRECHPNTKGKRGRDWLHR
jgi:hypothetical protein